MNRALASLWTALALLLCLAGSASAHVDLSAKNRVGFFGAIDENRVGEIDLLAPETQWLEWPMGYDPASDVRYGPNVYTYVNQNPWTMFDPLGLEAFKENQHVTKWRSMSEDGSRNPFVRTGAIGMTILESLNPFRSDSNIRQGGREMQINMAKGREGLKQAPPVFKQMGQITLGVGSAANPVAFADGLGQTGDSYNEVGAVETGKRIVKGTVDHAVQNPFEFGGSVGTGWAFGNALWPKGKITAPSVSARTILQQSQGIADDAIVHFGPGKFQTVKPSPGGDYFSAFRFGDIKNFTSAQIEGLIGNANSGLTGAAQVMHVINKAVKADEFGQVPGTKVMEYTVKGPQKVEKAVELER